MPRLKRNRGEIVIDYGYGKHQQVDSCGTVALLAGDKASPARRILIAAARALRPPKRLNLRKWADENRVMPAKAVFPGRWHTDRIPAAVEPYEEWNNPLIKEYIFAVAVQTLKTELIINAVLWHIELDPCNILLVLPDNALAREFSNKRLGDAAETMPYHKPYLAPGRNAKSPTGESTTIENRPFPGGFIRIGSVEGRSSLISTSYLLTIADEINKFKRNITGDLKGRQTMFGSKAVRIITSSVGVKGHCKITPMWESGDQREWNIQCPKCEKHHPPVWGNMDWEEGNPSTARYKCPECEYLLDNPQMVVANQNGKWIANAPFRGKASWRSNAFANPYIQLADLVEEYEDGLREYATTGSDDLLMTFWTDRMSVVYSPAGTGVNAAEMDKHLRINYPKPIDKRLTIPPEVVIITMAVDVQSGWFEAQWVGWGFDYDIDPDTKEKVIAPRAFMLKRVQVEADTSRDADYEKLMKLYNGTVFAYPNGMGKVAGSMGIDTGYRSENVARFIKRHIHDNISPIKGRDRERGRMIEISNNKKTTDKYGNALVWVETHVAKDLIYSAIRRSIDAVRKGKPGEARLLFPAGKDAERRGWDSDALESIASEMLYTKKDNRGNVKTYYKRVVDRNEGLDLLVYNWTMLQKSGIGNLPSRMRADDKEMRAEGFKTDRRGDPWQKTKDTTPSR